MAGAVQVQVSATGGATANTSADDFTYVTPPTVTAVSPTSGPTTGGTSVTITGTAFTGATAVGFGGTNLVVVSASKITAKAPAHAAGTVAVTVATPGGTSSISGTGNDYTYVAAPTITALSPTYGLTTGGNTVTITGTNLTGATAVKFGGTAATNVVVVSSTKITCKTPARAAGKVDVTVTTPKGTSSTSGTGNDYSYLAHSEQTDSRLVYSAGWATFSTPSAWAGSYKRASASSSYVIIPFNGTRLDWIATKGTTLGKANVSVDGKTPVVVDLAATSVAYKQRVFTTGTLTSGYHWLKISWNPTNAVGKYISVDAVEVAGSLTAATRCQETDAHLLYAPAWTNGSSPSASGSTYKCTNTTNAQVTIKFTGVGLTLLAYRGHQAGRPEERFLYRLHHRCGRWGRVGGVEVGEDAAGATDRAVLRGGPIFLWVRVQMAWGIPPLASPSRRGA